MIRYACRAVTLSEEWIRIERGYESSKDTLASEGITVS
jgi:hypothetical protein